MPRQEKTRVRATWAQGPKPMPPGHDFPPVGWGTSYTYEERVRRWRNRPRREQVSCTETRLTRNPEMPVVAEGNIYPYGYATYSRSRFDLEIRWSHGTGFWPEEEAAWARGSRWRTTLQPRKRGYWLKDLFLGEDAESVRKFISDLHAEALILAKKAHDEAVKRGTSAMTKLFQNIEKFDSDQPLLDRLGSFG